MATLGATSLGFRPPPPSTFSPSTRVPLRFSRCKPWPPPRCSVVDEQAATSEVSVSSFTMQENKLIDALIGIQGRGRSASPLQLQGVESAVRVLEESQGVLDPTGSGLIEGQWQLMFTTRPGTASLIQAIASIEDGKRILFRFDRAAFSFKFLPFKVPYPVPFKLLGDEAKGWLDTTYLSPSGNLRISRGNKGTTFVLQKESEPRQKLLAAISTNTGVKEAIEYVISSDKNVSIGDLELLEGEWLMIWSSQIETDSWIENAGNGLMGKQIIRSNGKMKFMVDILLGLKFSMDGSFVKSGTNKYDLSMNDAAILVGQFGLPVEMETKISLELLYTDEKIRISKGYKDITFIHVRMDVSKQR